ncbi:uncharacterized protein LOC108242538 isoform X2 [Kryptolebias marmoratus]|uniref:uncharacterized protein LOC108242538 isoform X2 n=1 Tax=Kryptolebias marmoratus TaxID=37003 RepID=UPI000D52F3DC|nr:uncharacterized protein LOC108242538 isoform X2 [Kryptolebias marmoratus]
MVEFRLLRFLFLILVLRSTATKQHSVFVREGDGVALSCENVADQVKCNRTTWSFSRYPVAATDLVKLGRIQSFQTPAAKSDRMGLGSNCSLMIQRVAAEDVGRYFCQQFNYPGQKQEQNEVDLSVVKITEHEEAEKVTFTCSVSTYTPAVSQEVKWLLNGQEIDEDNTELKTEESHLSANVRFSVTHFIYQSRYTSLKCEVGKSKQQFTIRSQTLGKEHKTSENIEVTAKSSGLWWVYVTVAVGLAAILVVVLLVGWRKNKGRKKTRKEENTRNESSVTLSGPETTRHTFSSL